VVVAALVTAAACMLPVQAQTWSPGQLDNLVSRIALYPDPLLAQVLTAATYYDQIPDAAAWADQHSYLQGDALAQAIQADGLPWDPSVLALLPFPSVLDAMARDMNWTQSLGEAVLQSRDAVMDAVQRMRHRAYQFGYLKDGPQCHVVAGGPYIEIVPVNPAIIFVPVYDSYWIYAPPRPGLAVSIWFGPRIFVNSFVGIGWRGPHFDWHAHTVIIDNRVWERTVVNRTTYVHRYREPVAVHRAPEFEHPHAEAGRPHPEDQHPHAEGGRPNVQGTHPYQYHETHEVKPNRSERVERSAPAKHEERHEKHDERR